MLRVRKKAGSAGAGVDGVGLADAEGDGAGVDSVGSGVGLTDSEGDGVGVSGSGVALADSDGAGVDGVGSGVTLADADGTGAGVDSVGSGVALADSAGDGTGVTVSLLSTRAGVVLGRMDGSVVVGTVVIAAGPPSAEVCEVGGGGSVGARLGETAGVSTTEEGRFGVFAFACSVGAGVFGAAAGVAPPGSVFPPLQAATHRLQSRPIDMRSDKRSIDKQRYSKCYTKLRQKKTNDHQIMHDQCSTILRNRSTREYLATTAARRMNLHKPNDCIRHAN